MATKATRKNIDYKAVRAEYKRIAPNYTHKELEDMFGVTREFIDICRRESGIHPKPTKTSNHPVSYWEEKFLELHQGELTLVGHAYRPEPNSQIRAVCKCLRCGTEWPIKNLHAKVRNKGGCIKCDKGHYGNKYTVKEVTDMMNKAYANQWRLITYGHYSKKDSVIQCTLCGKQQTVKLADFINTTTMRCTNCQTGSFGEYVIATTLLYNNIPFEREKQLTINGQKYRLDFLIDNRIALEYSGAQHFDTKGLYYNPKINQGVLIKQAWCEENGYEFVETVATYNIDEIVQMLEGLVKTTLTRPSPEFFRENNPDMHRVLEYMKTHSSRQTMKDLNVSITKVKKYVRLDGYPSISAWQADNKVKQ